MKEEYFREIVERLGAISKDLRHYEHCDLDDENSAEENGNREQQYAAVE